MYGLCVLAALVSLKAPPIAWDPSILGMKIILPVSLTEPLDVSPYSCMNELWDEHEESICDMKVGKDSLLCHFMYLFKNMDTIVMLF